ncbi:MAG TPA: hypothetical protein VJS92_10645 [Candidatus Polarisedimenticolaceae bacterium]|nr:hypothetical protein [Candidatus Polarisedimenticolaceae bacterium]
MTAVEAETLAMELDPVLVYAIVRYLREIYPASVPAARAVLDRVVALTSSSPRIVAMVKEGEDDPVARWFTSEYFFRDFKGRGNELIERIVDKLDS